MCMTLPTLCSGCRLEGKPHRFIIANVCLIALLLAIVKSKALFIGLGAIAATIAGLLALGYGLRKWQSAHLEWLRSQRLLRSLIAILFLKILFSIGVLGAGSEASGRSCRCTEYVRSIVPANREAGLKENNFMEFFDPVGLARTQFAATALYHFLFVPLTLGLVWLLVILEATYVMTGKQVWKDAVKFWGKLFGINFAMGVATGITMEFQFGTNWAYYAHYVGDIFGTPLAIEGLMAFFLESTMVGLFFFGWDKMSKRTHLACTFFLALGTNLSAVWILIANGWMQNPVGAVFNPGTMRMEMHSFFDLIFNPVAQSKFVHTVSAGYVCASVFMLAISSYFLARKQHLEVMKRSFAVAAAFGLAGSLSVVVLGDESGYTVNENQKMKIAALIEASGRPNPRPPRSRCSRFQTGKTCAMRAKSKSPRCWGSLERAVSIRPFQASKRF